MTRPEPAPAPRSARGHLAAAGVLVLLLALFFLPALVTSDQFLSRDSGRFHHPMKTWVAERWSTGTLPQWNPYAGLGVPVVAQAMDAVLHPFNLLLVALPFEAGFKGWVLLSYLMAGLGCYAWARALGCGWHAALAAGVAFMLSGHLVASSDNLQYLTTFAALPWMLVTAHLAVSRSGPARLAAVAAASFACAGAGDPQAWGTALLLTPVYLAVAFPPVRDRVVRIAAVTIASIAGAAPVVVPVLLWVPRSARALPLDTSGLAYWDFLPRRVLEVVVPNLVRTEPGRIQSAAFAVLSGGLADAPWVRSVYFGITVLLLAGAAVASSRPARFLVVAALAFAWSACGHHLGFARVAEHLPLFDRFRYWEKMFIWTTLLAVMAAGLGLDVLLRSGPRARRWFAAACGGAALALFAVRVAGALAPGQLLAVITPRPGDAVGMATLLQNVNDGASLAAMAALLLALVAVAAARDRAARWAPLLFLAAVTVDCFAANGHAFQLLPNVGPVTDAPLTRQLSGQGSPARVANPFRLGAARARDRTDVEAAWLWGERTLTPVWNVEQRIGNFDPYGGLPPADLLSIRARPLAEVMPTLGIWSVLGVVVPQDLRLADRAGLHPPLHVIAADPELPAWVVGLPHRPRAYLASDVRRAEVADLQRATMALDPVARTALVVTGVRSATARPGTATIVRDTPERVVVETSGPDEALLVLNDQFAPGWRARVDGASAPIVSVNDLARGVWLPAGDHRVELAYRTPGLVEGAVIAAAFLAGCALAPLVRRLRAAAR